MIPRLKFDIEVIVNEKIQLSDLPPIQSLSRGKEDHIFMVGHHLNTVLHFTQVGFPFNKGRDDRVEFFVIERVVDFWGRELSS